MVIPQSTNFEVNEQSNKFIRTSSSAGDSPPSLFGMPGMERGPIMGSTEKFSQYYSPPADANGQGYPTSAPLYSPGGSTCVSAVANPTSHFPPPHPQSTMTTDPSGYALGSYDMKSNGCTGEMWAPPPPPSAGGGTAYSTHPGATYYSYENFQNHYQYDSRYCTMDMTDGVRRKNATRESTNTLKAWLQEHKKNPYPTKGEKIMLAIITKMTLTQVSTWFANARRRLKKENKMTWVPKNRTSADSSANANSNTDGKNPDGDNDDDVSSSVKDGSESNLDDTDGDHQIVGCSPPSSMSTDDPTVGGLPKPISYLDNYQPPPVAQHTPFPPPPAAVASTTTSYTTNIYNSDAWGPPAVEKPSAAYFPADPFSYLKAGNKEEGLGVTPEWTPSNSAMSLNGNDAGYFSTGYLPKLSDTTVAKTTMSTYPGHQLESERSGFDGLGVVGEPGAPANDYYVPPYGYHHPPMHHVGASSSSTYQPLTSHYYSDKATSSVYGSSSMLVDSHHHHPHHPHHHHVDGDSKVPLIRNDFATSGNLFFPPPPPPPHSSYVTDAPQVGNYYQATTQHQQQQQQQQSFTEVATTSENSSSSATSSAAVAAAVLGADPPPPPPTGSLLRVSPSSGQGPASAVSSPPQLFNLQHSSSSTQQSAPQAAATIQQQPHPM